MRLKNCSVDTFVKRIHGKKIMCYGAGRVLRTACEKLGDEFIQRIECIIDKKGGEGCFFEIANKRIPLISPEQIQTTDDTNTVVVITPIVYDEIYNELQGQMSLDKMDCYIYPIMRDTARPHGFPLPAVEAEMRIPKRINYIWFGGGKMSDLNKRCIESWYKFCPDYEIIQFDEDNYDVTKLPFMYEAYKAKKWAIAADYARFDILREYGGIYIDTDIELIKNIDFTLYNDFFGYLQGDWLAVNFMGCKAGFPLIEKLMAPYIQGDYLQIKSSTDYSEKIIVDNYRVNKMLEYGFKVWQDGEKLNGGANIFPQDTITLNTRTGNITDNTVGIHYYERTWCEELIPKEERFGRFYAEHADELKVEG